MKVKSEVLLMIFICSFSIQMFCHAQQNILPNIPLAGKICSDFIPVGYDILLKKEVDLNNDKRDDVILIFKNKLEDLEKGEDIDKDNSNEIKYNRILVILFKTDAGYSMAAKANNLTICKVCGFAMHPIDDESIQLRNGGFTLFQYGGRTQQWSLTRKFRYLNGDFYMIGMTDERHSFYMNATPCNSGTPGSSYHDINLVTGDRIVKKIDDDCKTINRHDKIKIKPLIKIASVNLNSYDF